MQEKPRNGKTGRKNRKNRRKEETGGKKKRGAEKSGKRNRKNGKIQKPEKSEKRKMQKGIRKTESGKGKSPPYRMFPRGKQNIPGHVLFLPEASRHVTETVLRFRKNIFCLKKSLNTITLITCFYSRDLLNFHPQKLFLMAADPGCPPCGGQTGFSAASEKNKKTGTFCPFSGCRTNPLLPVV